MTTTQKFLLAGGAALVGLIAYRRYKASQTAAAQPSLVTAAANLVTSAKAVLSTPTAAPVALAPGGMPYGTVATTDLQKAAAAKTFVPAPERFSTDAQNALIGIFPSRMS